MIKQLLAVLLAFAVKLPALAGQVYASRTYTTMDGLMSGELYSYCLADRKNRIWVSSASGLSRFDGVAFKHFPVDQGRLTAAQSVPFRDREGRIWIYCNDLHDAKKDYITIIQADRIERQFPVHGSLIYLPWNDEKILIRTNGEVWRYDERTAAFEPACHLNLPAICYTPQYDVSVRTDVFSRRLLLYIRNKSGAQGLLYAWSPGEKLTLLTAKFPGKTLPQYWSIHGLPDGDVLCGDASGLYRLPPHTNKWKSCKPFPDLPDQTDGKQLAVGPQLLLTRQTGRFESELIVFNPVFPQGVSLRFRGQSADFTVCARGHDGSYWIPTRNGLIRLFPAVLQCKPEENPQMPADLHTICEDAKGRIWFGSYTDGLGYFDGRHIGRKPEIGLNRFLPGSYRDQDGRMYFWTEMDVPGLYRFDGGQQAACVAPKEIGFHIRRLDEGTVVLGLAGFRLGIARGPDWYKPQNWTIIGVAQGLKLVNVLTALRDRHGRFWMGRPSQGIACYDPANGRASNFLIEDRLRDPGAMSACMDHRGNLWFGTNKGLYFLDNREPFALDSLALRHRLISVGAEQLGTSQINTLLPVPGDLLFVGNKSGFHLLDLPSFYTDSGMQHPVIFSFNAAKGYSGHDVEQNSAMLDRQGRIWFATDDGAYRVDTRLLHLPPAAVQCNIDSLNAGGRCYSGAADYRVRPAERNLVVYLSAQQDALPVQADWYGYRLNADTGFQVLRDRNTLEFNALAPGRYRLDVAAFYNGIPSGVKRIEFTIPYFMGEQPWFWPVILIFILGILTAFGFYRYRQELRLARQKVEKSSLQAQVIANQLNPHFINNTLQILQIHTFENPLAVRIISRLAENIRIVFKQSRMARPYHLLSEEMSLVSNYLLIQKERFGDKLTYELPDQATIEQVGHTVVPLMQVLIHCENAVEHGIRNQEAGGWLRVELTDDPDYLYCLIEDNGIGRHAARQMGSLGTKQGTRMLGELQEIFNRNNTRKINTIYEDGIFTLTDGSVFGTRVRIRIPKNFVYEFGTRIVALRRNRR
ncbi:MAG: histidine kinase [Thermoanaerobaculia bacterium]|nr:histidine kinase [Thermoanaerobaculia bacterium]